MHSPNTSMNSSKLTGPGNVHVRIASDVVCSFMTDNIKPMSEAAKWYDEFNQMKVQKVIFEADK